MQAYTITHDKQLRDGLYNLYYFFVLSLDAHWLTTSNIINALLENPYLVQHSGHALFAIYFYANVFIYLSPLTHETVWRSLQCCDLISFHGLSLISGKAKQTKKKTKHQRLWVSHNPIEIIISNAIRRSHCLLPKQNHKRIGKAKNTRIENKKRISL